MKARLQESRGKVELSRHDRRVLEHLEQLDTQEMGGKGGAATPVSLALLDLAAELDKMKPEYEVVLGDKNVRHPRSKPSSTAAGKMNTAVVQRFAPGRELVEPQSHRCHRCHRGTGGE